MKLDIPQHLEGRIATFRKYAFFAFPMAIVKNAVDKGDFVPNNEHNGVPMVLVIED